MQSVALNVPSHLSDDDRGFLAAPGRRLLDEGYLLLDYVFETWDDPWKAAVHLCREQSTALWQRVGVTEDYRPRHAALLVEMGEAVAIEHPSAALPGPHRNAWWRVRVRLAHPTANFGPRLPNLLTAVAGEGAFFTPSIPLVRLEDIHFPPSFLAHFEGPRFGVRGLREILGVQGRPLIAGVIKPNIGMPIEPFAELGYQALKGGADIVKDDEMLADAPYSPVAARAARVYPRVRSAALETGENKLYLMNITDEVTRIGELYDVAFAIGGGYAAVMLNALPVGVSACRIVTSRARVPVFSHFDMIAPMARLSCHGVSALVWTKLQRLVGFDAIIMPGLSSRMHLTSEEVVQNLRACLEPMGAIAPCLPMPGGSDWAGSVKAMFETFGTVDFGMVPGRGIFGHPSGPAAGARSLRDACDLVSRGLDPADPAVQTDAIREAFRELGT